MDRQGNPESGRYRREGGGEATGRYARVHAVAADRQDPAATVRGRRQPLEHARESFLGTRESIYLNAAGLGLVSANAVAAAATFLAACERDPAKAHHERPGPADYARELAAELVGGKAHEIALVPSTTLALMAAALAVPLTNGDNVVTCNLEFMSCVVPWYEKCQAAGAQLRVARHQAGRISPDSVLELIDRRTRAVALSAVEWTNGFRLDLEAIGAACRRRRVPLIVDGIQQVGAIRLDVETSGIAFLACGGHKWLGSPSALGFAYVSGEFAERYRLPITYAPTAVSPDPAGWAVSWTDPTYEPVRTYEARSTAAQFELGVHHGGMSAATLGAALSVIKEVGLDVIEAHVLDLGELLARGLRDRGLEIVTPLERAHRSGITTFRVGADSDDDVALSAWLAAAGIMTSVRFTAGIGGVRVSPHLYNTAGDIEALLLAVDDWRRGCAPAWRGER